MLKRRITQCLTLLGLWLLPLPIPLLLPHAVAQVRQPPAAVQTPEQPPALLHSETDFQTDCRSEFQIAGTVDWQPGKLTLQPKATIGKEVNGNWQGEWQFDLACEAVPAETTAEFVFQVTMNDGATPWQLVWLVSPNGTGTLTLFDTMIQKERQQLLKIRQSPLAAITGTWQVRYCYGMVQVQHNGQQVLVGYFENYTRGIGSGQWQSKQVRLTFISWQHCFHARPKLAKEQQQQVQQADQLNAAGFAAYTQGKYSEAEPLYQRSLLIREQTRGKQHPETALSLDNLAGLYQAQGKYNEAEPLYQRALAIYEQTLGKEHPNTASSRPRLSCGVKFAEFDTSVGGGELPIDTDLAFVAVLLPGLDFLLHLLGGRDAAIEALPLQNAPLDLGHVQPTAVLRRVVSAGLDDAD